MKIFTGKTYKFVCDSCGVVAGEDSDEREALRQAREKAQNYRWEWRHPHWGLICSECLRESIR